MFLCLVLHLLEWSPIVDSFLDSNPKYEVSSEMFDPSFFLCKISKNSKFEVHAKKCKILWFRMTMLVKKGQNNKIINLHGKTVIYTSRLVYIHQDSYIYTKTRIYTARFVYIQQDAYTAVSTKVVPQKR